MKLRKDTLELNKIRKFEIIEKIANFAHERRDARVVEWDGLENRCTLTGTQGSNPCLSAPFKASNQHDYSLIELIVLKHL